MRKILYCVVLVLLFYPFGTSGQEINISDQLKLIKLTENTYIHTGNGNNGLIFCDRGEAVIVSTPDSDTETQKLIDYVRNNLHLDIKAYVIDRWHPDSMGGLAAVTRSGIKSYSNVLTQEIAKRKGLPVPETGFDPLLELKVGNEKIICDYLGAAHTSDGIIVWIPKDSILFGGNSIRNYGGWYGNIGDADLQEWSNTVTRIKVKYGAAKIVIPGHGIHGGPELIDYTINLYKPSVWGQIIKAHDMKSYPLLNYSDRILELAESDTILNNVRHLRDAIVFVINEGRYIKIQSNKILHDTGNRMLTSDSGRLQFYDLETRQILEDLYYRQLYVNLREDAVGWTVILKEAIR